MDSNSLLDEFRIEVERNRGVVDTNGLVGFGMLTLRGPDGEIKSRQFLRNLITDAGDLYYAQKGIVGISPANPTAPTAISGMKLGTGTTAVAKSGAGAALITYLSGSNAAFSATYPQATNLGAGLGVTMVYACSWAAGVATHSALTEIVMVNDAGTDATSSAANTIARIVFTATPKGASDTLTFTWSHKNLGA